MFRTQPAPTTLAHTDWQGGVEELVFAVPEPPQHAKPSGGGDCGGFLGPCFEPCCGAGPSAYADSDDEGGGEYESGDEMDDYNCLGGGILAGCLPEVRESRLACCFVCLLACLLALLLLRTPHALPHHTTRRHASYRELAQALSHVPPLHLPLPLPLHLHLHLLPCPRARTHTHNTKQHNTTPSVHVNPTAWTFHGGFLTWHAMG